MVTLRSADSGQPAVRTIRRPQFASGAIPGFMLVHAGLPVSPHDVWTEWTPEPFTLAGIGVLSWLYGLGVSRLWARGGKGRSISSARVAAGTGGIVWLGVALLSPLEVAAGALFSLHMVQHLLLVLVAAPLLVIGRLHLALLWSMPSGMRRALGRGWARSPRFRRVASGFTVPGVAWVLHAVALWLWHAPVLYDLAAANDAWHAVEHASFMITAILFALPLERLWRAGGARLSHGTALLYVFSAAMQSGALGALLALSRSSWYAAHREAAPMWGITPLDDQQLAGVLMWGPASVAYLVVMLLLVRLWLSRAPLPRGAVVSTATSGR